MKLEVYKAGMSVHFIRQQEKIKSPLNTTSVDQASDLDTLNTDAEGLNRREAFGCGGRAMGGLIWYIYKLCLPERGAAVCGVQWADNTAVR